MTFREAIRRRIVLTGLVLGFCFLITYSIGFHYIIRQIGTTVRTSGTDPSHQAMLIRAASVEGENALLLAGLYAVTFLSIAMAALLGADTLSGEINSGTIQTIVTKPIRRSSVVLGKWLGFALLLGLYFLLMAGGTVLSVLLQTGYAPNHLISGLALIYFEDLLIMTISLACSSAFSAAFIGGWMEQFGTFVNNATAIKLGIIVSLIIPSESLWRRAAYEMQTPFAGALGVSPFSTTSVPSLLMIVYTAFYLLVFLGLAIYIFERRDL